MVTAARPTAVPVYLGQLVQFGSITNSVKFFDVALPDGYSRFQFFFTGVTVTAPGVGDYVSAALRVAGNFANDPINNDTYFNVTAATASPLIKITPQQTDIANNPKFRAGCLVDIYPGDNINWPVVTVNYSWAYQTGGVTFSGQALWTLDQAATIPPTHGQATLMRVQPLGNRNCNPPTSTNTIDTGDWRLYAYN